MILLPSSGFAFDQAMELYIALSALSATGRLFLAQSALMKCASAIRAFEAHSGSAVLATTLAPGTAFKVSVPNRLPELGAGHRAADHRRRGLVRRSTFSMLDAESNWHPVLLEIDAHHDLGQAADHDGRLLALEVGGA